MTERSRKSTLQVCNHLSAIDAARVISTCGNFGWLRYEQPETPEWPET